MTRVCIVCEGTTEVAFVQRCLYPHLIDHQIFVQPLDLRGNVSVARLADFVCKEYHRHDRITTLVDFYGFKQRPEGGRTDLEKAILDAVCKKMPSGDAPCFLPYVQMHEFEALLFSDIKQFQWVLEGWNEKTRDALLAVKKACPCPEDINDGEPTAPSKRLDRIFCGYYSKVVHGPIIAQETGLAVIRAQCPLFNAWLTQVERWGQ